MPVSHVVCTHCSTKVPFDRESDASHVNCPECRVLIEISDSGNRGVLFMMAAMSVVFLTLLTLTAGSVYYLFTRVLVPQVAELRERFAEPAVDVPEVPFPPDEPFVPTADVAPAVRPWGVNPALPVPSPQAPAGAEDTGEAKVEQLVADLLKGFPQHLIALQHLSVIPPGDEYREVVLSATRPLLQHENPLTRTTAGRVVSHWATEAEIPLLAELIKGPDVVVRMAVLDRLGRIPCRASADLLVSVLRNPGGDLFWASNSLVKLGPVAEEAVLEVFNDENEKLRIEACRILRQIGGERTKQVLEEQLPNQPERGLLRTYMQRALSDIDKRMQESE